MANTVAASNIVSVTPGVLSPGGAGIHTVGVVLTNDPRVPVDAPVPFFSELAVSQYFGQTSPEAIYAGIYFRAPDGALARPSKLYFMQYAGANGAPGALRGGALTQTLAQLQAVASTSLIVSINGTPVTSSAFTLAAATSFSNAAAIIQQAINTYDATLTASITGTTMTVSARTGVLAPGQVITASAGIIAPTVIVSQLTGTTGGVGTYQVSQNYVTPLASGPLTAGQTTVAYDSNAGAFVITGGTPATASSISIGSGGWAAPLGLTALNGATALAGSGPGDPATAMNGVISQTTDWATFSTLFKPSETDALGFAAWASAQKSRYGYVLWDTDANVLTPGNTSNLLARIKAANYESVAYIYAPVNRQNIAAFVQGYAASLNFDLPNGRVDLGHRSQAGLPADVSGTVIDDELKAAGVNRYEVIGSGESQFFRYLDGTVTGPYPTFTDFINQIWLTTALQNNALVYFGNARTTPYNAAGYQSIYAMLSDVVGQAVTFGMIQKGVTLSSSQISLLTSQAGKPIDRTIFTQGWYMQVVPATPVQRAAHAPVTVNLWYTTGENILRLNIFSVELA